LFQQELLSPNFVLSLRIEIVFKKLICYQCNGCVLEMHSTNAIKITPYIEYKKNGNGLKKISLYKVDQSQKGGSDSLKVATPTT
jgi:hypothetical protein